MVDYSTLSIVLTGIGLIVAITYYTITLRNTSKSRQRELIFQRLQGYSLEYTTAFAEVANMKDWSSTEEWRNKYGSEANPEAWARYTYIKRVYNLAGILLKENITDAKLIFQLYPPYSVIRMWEQFVDLNDDLRRRSNYPTAFEGFEFLYNEAKKMFPKVKSPGQPL